MQRIYQVPDRQNPDLGSANVPTGTGPAPPGADNVTTAEASAAGILGTALQSPPAIRISLLLPQEAVEVRVEVRRIPAAMGLLMAQGPFQYLGSGRFVVPAATLPVLDDHSIKYERAAEGEAA